MNKELSVDTDVATAAMRAQSDQAARGWRTPAPSFGRGCSRRRRPCLEWPALNPAPMSSMWPPAPATRPLILPSGLVPTAYVLATDLSPAILQFAAQQAAAAGHRNFETRVSDGQNLQVEGTRFDAVVCRLGLMFFGDPLQGLREMARVLKPGGGVCTMVFGSPQANPCVTTLMSTALGHAGLPPRDPFQPGGLLSLGKPGLIDDLFKGAGIPRVREHQRCSAVSPPDRQGLHEIHTNIGGADRRDIEEP